MQNYFKKIQLDLGDLDKSRLKGKFFEGYLGFNSFDIKDKNYLSDIICKKIKFNIKPDYVNLSEVSDGGAYPHTDHNFVALNYYIDGANYTTSFYTIKNEEENQGDIMDHKIDPKYSNSRQCRARQYNFNQIVPVQSFKAQSGEAYLLNIKHVHSALRFNNDKSIRTIIKWMWENEDFETIKDSIEILD